MRAVNAAGPGPAAGDVSARVTTTPSSVQGSGRQCRRVRCRHCVVGRPGVRRRLADHRLRGPDRRRRQVPRPGRAVGDRHRSASAGRRRRSSCAVNAAGPGPDSLGGRGRPRGPARAPTIGRASSGPRGGPDGGRSLVRPSVTGGAAITGYQVFTPTAWVRAGGSSPPTPVRRWLRPRVPSSSASPRREVPLRRPCREPGRLGREEREVERGHGALAGWWWSKPSRLGGRAGRWWSSWSPVVELIETPAACVGALVSACCGLVRVATDRQQRRAAPLGLALLPGLRSRHGESPETPGDALRRFQRPTVSGRRVPARRNGLLIVTHLIVTRTLGRTKGSEHHRLSVASAE